MKIAIISDIHGNMQALTAVLDDIKTQHCEKILCLGDLAMAGPEPETVVDFIKTQNWSMIQGNTDEMIAYYTDDVFNKVKDSVPIMANALKSDSDLLSKENKEFLKNLPRQLTIDIENVRILMVHGSPRKNNEDILPDLAIEEVEDMIEGIDADIVFCGHTHMPCGYQTNTGKTVVNVGSVGRPFTQIPDSCYVVAELNNGEINVTHRFVTYDNKKAAKLLENRNFVGSEKLAGMLIKPETRHM